LEPNIGLSSAAGTALCWSLTTMFFAAAGRRIGSFTVNQVRLVFAVILLGGLHLIMQEALWPTWATGRQLVLLAASGVIGLVFGDSCLFRCFVVLGEKGAALMMTLWPAMAFILAWPILGETPTFYVFVGMAVTLSGVALAVLSRRRQVSQRQPKPSVKGILLGLGGAFGQALGYVVAKPALVEGGVEQLSALSGTLVRMVTAAVIIWCVAGIQLILWKRKGNPNPIVEGVRKPRAMAQTFCGSFCGPFLGVWLSLKAVQHLDIGVATTVMATVPILVIPWMFIAYRERPRVMELVGAAIAIAGVGLLFIRPEAVS
jgi:drug/metabolite transporter (DMT)-like permease